MTARACVFASIAAMALMSATTHADAPLEDLSLEELTSLTVTTTTRHLQRAEDAAAALFVLTQDDIRRSGATSLPQALRLVPGMQVAQIDASRWAISIRGFNSRLSNRILVLIDGRSLYSSVSGGVLWDAQDTMIEEIERIEVVRGPGGAIWGSNAFNGVINIITKSAEQTGGFVAGAEVGPDSNAMAALRFGDADGRVKWRVFGKYLDGAMNEDRLDESTHDFWRQSRIGARSDVELSGPSELRLNFEAYSGRAGLMIYEPDALIDEIGPVPEDMPTMTSEELIDGGFAGLRFEHRLANDWALSADASLQYYSRESPLLGSHGRIGELNVQHVSPRLGGHRLTLGAGVRATTDAVDNDAIWRFTRDEMHTWTYSAFLQDEYAMFNERLLLTAGAKVEDSEYDDVQAMPSLRLRFSATPQTTLWGAVSRGLRTPSLIERYGRFAGKGLRPGSALNPMPGPLYMDMWGDEQMRSERVAAFELGVRAQLIANLSVDLALFRNELQGLRGIGRLLDLTCEPSGLTVADHPYCIDGSTHFTLPGQLTNVYDEVAQGGELVVTYHPTPGWRLVGSYSHIEHAIDDATRQFGAFRSDPRSFGGGYDPRHRASVRSSLRLGSDWEFDALLRYVDELPDGDVPEYTELNLRVAWRAAPQLELAFVGYNLLRDRHQEFSSDFFDMRSVWIERSLVLQGRWSY